ncbi:MAG: recombinase family protein [Clostridia bacterium]|nr:recombinase family protein [Clostridia bacterium]
MNENVVGYIRVSTNKEEQLISLKEQKENLKKYIESRGDTLIKIYSDEGKSGTGIKNRKGYNDMMASARRKEFTKIYCKDQTRLHRNTLNAINFYNELANLGISLHLTNIGQAGTDVDSFTLNLLSLLAQKEAENISERTRATKAESRKKGIVPNFVLGYDKDPNDKYNMFINEDEANIVRTIFNLYTEDRIGMPRISQYLFEQGYKTKKMKTGTWSQNTVGQILENEIYIGNVCNGKERSKSAIDHTRIKVPREEWDIVHQEKFRIISDEQFNKAKQIRAENAEKFPQGTRSEKFLFSNLIKCGSCGFSYRRYIRKYSENTAPKIWWVCSKRSAYGNGRCTAEHIRIEEEWLKEGIIKLLKYLLSDKENFHQMIEEKCDLYVRNYIKATTGEETSSIKDEISALESKKDKYIELATDGLITMDEARKKITPINNKLQKLKFTLEQKDNTKELIKKTKDNVQKFFDELDNINLDESLNNADLKKIIKKIVINSKEDINVYFNLDFDDYTPPTSPETTPSDSDIFFPMYGTFLTDTNTPDRTQGRNRAS